MYKIPNKPIDLICIIEENLVALEKQRKKMIIKLDIFSLSETPYNKPPCLPVKLQRTGKCLLMGDDTVCK